MEDREYIIKELEQEISSLEDTIIDKDREIEQLKDEIESGSDFKETLVRLFDDFSLELSEGGQFLFQFYVIEILSRIKTGSYDYILRC
jgi:hypothetical protein